MGLFDSLYDPQTYSGGGGLIDRLLAQLQGQGQYQPSQGFPQPQMDASASMPPAQTPGRTFDNAMFNPATYAPTQPGPMNANAQEQNDPIAVGNYMMPRIGSGFPDDVEPATPQSAAPTQAMQQPGQPMQAQQQPPAFLQPQHSAGGFGGAMRGVMANAALGPLGWIGGGIAGARGRGSALPRNSNSERCSRHMPRSFRLGSRRKRPCWQR